MKTQGEQSYRQKRPLWIITIWRWGITLSLYAVLAYLAFNFNQFALQARLAGETSLFRNWVVLSVALAAILLLTSAIHEVGHLAAGKLARLHFHLLMIGPLRLERRSDRLKISWQRGAAMFNGMAASLPRDTRNLRPRMLLFAAGGPLASLLLALLAAGVYAWLASGRIPAYPSWLRETAVMTAVISLVFFLTTMRPGHYQNGFVADGGRMAILLQDDAISRRWCALVALSSADYGGQRPVDWNVHLLDQATAIHDNSYDSLTGQLMAYQAAIDRGEIDQAEALLTDALHNDSALLTGLHGRLALEYAYLLAFHRGDGVNGRFWLQQVYRHKPTLPLQWRAEAAVALAEGDLSTAATCIQSGLKLSAQQPPTGTAQAETAWLQQMANSLSNVN